MDRRAITATVKGQRQSAAALPLYVVRMARGLSVAAALALLSACASAPMSPPASGRQTAAADPRNGDGLGGTGINAQSKTASKAPGDGLGGTGIIGTISGFGSIIVNGKELEFDHTTAVGNDGRPAALDALRIGQVIQGVARRRDGRLTLESLDIQHAVSGPIAAIDYAAQTMTVLSQTVRLNLSGDKVAEEAFRSLHAGDVVSVSGLRTNDGSIVASRVDQESDDGRLVVRAEAVAVSGDKIKIGGLEVAMTSEIAVSKPVNGGRAFVSGRLINGAFVPDVITGGGLPFTGNVGDVSLEGYVPAGPLALHGMPIDAALSATTSVGDHIVVTGQVSGSDRVTAATIAKLRTVVTIMKAHGAQRPAAMRPDTTRQERVAPVRPEIQRPQSVRPDIQRPQIERPTALLGV